MKYLIAIFLTLFLTQSISAATSQRGLAIRPKAPTGEAVTGNLWVLTIGIDSYISWPRLNTAINDAKALKNVLLDRYHVDQSRVIELYDENATRRNILAALRDLTKKVKPEDSLLIYYAGHGHIDSITKNGSWIPVESGTEDPSAWIDNRSITDYLNIDAIKAKHILLVSDSCFSGGFFQGTRGTIPEVTDTVIKKAYQLSSRQAITSGGLEPVSDSGFGGNSVFAHFLISALMNNNKPYLIPSELFPSIKAGVAQNAEQFPQMGSLYGVGGQDGGELVLFLKQAERLDELSATSVTRQNELEQLKKVEAEASAAKQKEQAEIAKKLLELDVLDKQIAEMKARLGSRETRSSDSLDAILAMVEEKGQQGKRLEELRKQREAEEQKRQQEIGRIRQEMVAKRIEQIKADLVKYQKVVSSKYGQDMKSAAWDALVASYPEAKEVVRYDVDAFLSLQGLVFDNVRVATAQDNIKSEENTNLILTDQQTGLMWARNGNIANDKMNWNIAMRWVNALNYGGYSDWRLPTKYEFESFIKRVGIHNLSTYFENVEYTFYWTSSSNKDGNDYAYKLNINTGSVELGYKRYEYYLWPVRNAH